MPPAAKLNQLVAWDFVVLDAVMAVNQVYAPYLGPTGSLRTANPNLVVAAYFSSADIIPWSTNAFNVSFRSGLLPAWYMHDTSGATFPLFSLSPGYTHMLNLTTELNTYMPTFLQTNVMASGKYDGIFFDWVNGEIAWLNHRVDPPNRTDVDDNGLPDADAFLDAQWTAGMSALLANARATFPADALVYGNGGWYEEPTLDPLLNGFMIEQFLEGEGFGVPFDWSSIMRSYRDHLKIGPSPDFSMVMGNRDGPAVGEDLADADLAFMRFTLASTLLYDGYFAFTNRTGAYTQTWWFDEYAVEFLTGAASSDSTHKGWLGSPLGPAYSPSAPSVLLSTALGTSGSVAATQPWRRDFTSGIVFANPGPATTVTLEEPFRRILGNDDPAINDGALVSGDLALPARSGVLLLRQVPPLCESAPRTDCAGAAPGRATLSLRRSSDHARDRLDWKWISASGVGSSAYGDPASTTTYAVCVYETPGAADLLLDVEIPAGGTCAGRPCWKPTSSGFQYKNPLLGPDGALKLTLGAGAAGKASIKLEGMGPLLELPLLGLAAPVHAQLVRKDGGGCWEATFSAPQINAPARFKARSN